MTADKSGRTSAGILLWRSRKGRLEVLLAHQGGPFWVKKDIGHWTIPKGEVEPGEEFVAVARRESCLTEPLIVPASLSIARIADAEHAGELSSEDDEESAVANSVEWTQLSAIRYATSTSHFEGSGSTEGSVR